MGAHLARAVVARRARVVLAAVLAAAVGVGCGPSSGPERTEPTSTEIRTGPLTPTDPSRVPSEQAAAITALALIASNRGPDDTEHGHSHAGAVTEAVLAPFDQIAFDEQLAKATAALPALDTTEEAAAAGYVVAAAPGPGVGTHWVKWSLIDRPFDPAAPAMLLFHDRPGRPSQLVAYSYWLHSDTKPEGFAGRNDHWHRHTGLCVVNGWVDREMADACAGVYLGGADLWMLHAWIVPGWQNRWGTFAVMNPLLCPRSAGTPEMLRCPDDAGAL